MTVDGIRLRIAAPTDLFLQGRGFYQVEEDSLYVQLQPSETNSRVFSYLESDNLRIDIDQAGRILFIELNDGRHTWTIDESLSVPSSLGYADIRCLEFRFCIPPPILATNNARSVVALTFGSAAVDRSYRIADSVILQTSAGNFLNRIIVTDIVDDLAGREIAAFRQSIRGVGGQALERTPPHDL